MKMRSWRRIIGTVLLLAPLIGLILMVALGVLLGSMGMDHPLDFTEGCLRRLDVHRSHRLWMCRWWYKATQVQELKLPETRLCGNWPSQGRKCADYTLP
jgi:hypothetical protein